MTASQLDRRELLRLLLLALPYATLQWHRFPQGPSADGSGHDDGFYLLLEASTRYADEKAVLVSRPVSHGHGYTHHKCLSFLYHMYGKCLF